MVEVTAGGRGMGAIADRFRYISKNGHLAIEDDREVILPGKEALDDLVDHWRHDGSLIDEVGTRREAFNLMLSMPADECRVAFTRPRGTSRRPSS
jgi:hypothetical protein